MRQIRANNTHPFQPKQSERIEIMTETLETITPEAAEAQLLALDNPTSEPVVAETKPEIESQQAETVQSGEVETPNTTTDTQAAADKAPEPQKQAQPDKRSEFAKSNERLEKTWKSVNAEKESIAKLKQDLAAKEQFLTQREQKIQEQSARASQKFTPEQHEVSSQEKLKLSESYALQADGLDAKANKLEEDGEYGKAEQARSQAQELREASVYQKGVAKQLKEYAAHLRSNPDPTLAQIQARNQEHVRHYTMEAAKNWPDVAKEGSEFQKQMVQHLQAAQQAGLDVNEHPVLMYHVARLTAAESAAACVPELQKKLGKMEARVKELEAETTPGGGQSAAAQSSSSAVAFEKMSVDEQAAYLERMP